MSVDNIEVLQSQAMDQCITFLDSASDSDDEKVTELIDAAKKRSMDDLQKILTF